MLYLKWNFQVMINHFFFLDQVDIKHIFQKKILYEPDIKGLNQESTISQLLGSSFFYSNIEDKKILFKIYLSYIQRRKFRNWEKINNWDKNKDYFEDKIIIK